MFDLQNPLYHCERRMWQAVDFEAMIDLTDNYHREDVHLGLRQVVNTRWLLNIHVRDGVGFVLSRGLVKEKLYCRQ